MTLSEAVTILEDTAVRWIQMQDCLDTTDPEYIALRKKRSDALAICTKQQQLIYPIQSYPKEK